MTRVRTRIRIAQDGTLSGRVSGLPAGEHDAELLLIDGSGPGGPLQMDTLLARVRAIQKEVAKLPVLDLRTSDEILGYNERGHFD
jgi:hypothetical protein